MLDFVFLSDEFFSDYAKCKEIERKKDRPHIQITIQVGNHIFCIPMRSNINHKHVLWTDKENKCGIDFSKAVVIIDPTRYIDLNRKPHIRKNEFKELKRVSEYEVRRRMLAYIKEYKEAKRKPNIPRNKMLLECSTLQYFEEYI